MGGPDGVGTHSCPKPTINCEGNPKSPPHTHFTRTYSDPHIHLRTAGPIMQNPTKSQAVRPALLTTAARAPDAPPTATSAQQLTSAQRALPGTSSRLVRAVSGCPVSHFQPQQAVRLSWGFPSHWLGHRGRPQPTSPRRSWWRSPHQLGMDGLQYHLTLKSPHSLVNVRHPHIHHARQMAVTSCPSGTFDSHGVCAQCPSNCATCLTVDQCTACAATHKLSSGACGE